MTHDVRRDSRMPPVAAGSRTRFAVYIPTCAAEQVQKNHVQVTTLDYCLAPTSKPAFHMVSCLPDAATWSQSTVRRSGPSSSGDRVDKSNEPQDLEADGESHPI